MSRTHGLLVLPDGPRRGGAGGGVLQMQGAEPGRGGKRSTSLWQTAHLSESRVAAPGPGGKRVGWGVGQRWDRANICFISMVIDTEGNPMVLHSLK